MKGGKEEKGRPVDWDEARRRLESAGQAQKKGWSPGEAEKKRLLKARAKALAAGLPGTEPGEQIEIIQFFISYESYAVEAHYVREVRPLPEYAPVPCTPPFVLGIINVRGEILSVIDIGRFFDVPAKGLGDLNRVIILSSGEMELGVLADAIAGVRMVPLQDLQPPPPTFTGLRREYLRGLTRDGCALLDAGKILSDRRITVNEFV
jgi:purine-binding chemotaxis protein CheW